MTDEKTASDWLASQSLPWPKRHSSLKVNQYVLLSNLHTDSHDRWAQWRETTELPENCVGGSSWVINDLDLYQASPLVSKRSLDSDHMRLKEINRIKTKTSKTWPAGLDKHSQDQLLDVDARGRKHLWSLSPAAFHQSFDDRLKSCEEAVFSNSCSNIEEQVRRDHGRRTRRAGFCSGDTSKGPMPGGYGFSGNDGLSSGGTRPPNLGGRSPQSSFDSNGDVGQVTLNLMRVNGTMPGFKTLLASSNSNSPGSLQRNQNLAREALSKFSTATPPIAPQVICGEFVKRKDSLGRPRKESDVVILPENGKIGYCTLSDIMSSEVGFKL
ncbi:unnamed protein product [Bursaphelenchus okinawaensis]|uniref:Uncharacterized protein n=1 Tax=Bursaphelenchus okinawaensis TaxID=465554 RepID=A0A811JTB3_9BILA|nr:unnamed protein product [Bursaphelenchus okinawaensis]CAG9081531.1 unnamed protein product [Bursaphelenchus okinawaensis]